MKLSPAVIDELRVSPGQPANLDRRSSADTSAEWLETRGHALRPRDVADEDLLAFKEDLASAQELLYASDTFALLVILQALDAAGKDGTIKHVMSGVNPQGCQVVSFKQPSVEELQHDFLWRCASALPPKGRIGIFNRSYYEEVLVVRVHPNLLEAQHLPAGMQAGDRLWKQRFDDINAFERHLHRSGTRIVKLFLHLSAAEQKKRFIERIDDPSKHWKFSSADIAERAYFAEYQRAYEEAITATSTSWAPWYVVPADHKYACRALVGGIVAHVIDQLGLALPETTAGERAALAAAREQLLSE